MLKGVEHEKWENPKLKKSFFKMLPNIVYYNRKKLKKISYEFWDKTDESTWICTL